LKIEERFAEQLLDNIVWPTSTQSWNVEGIIKNRSNESYKFDVRPMIQLPDGQVGKKGNTSSNANKIVLEFERDWVIIDVKELHQYIKDQKLKIIQVDDLLNKLDWNIIIPKK
jgi:hypothetical protein